MAEFLPSGLATFSPRESGVAGLLNDNWELLDAALVAGGLGGAAYAVPTATTGTAVQTAITSLAGTGGVVFVGPGDYPVSTTITVPDGVEIWGMGRRTLYKTGAPNLGPVFEAQAGLGSDPIFDLSGVSGAGNTQAEKKALRNLTIDGNNLGVDGILLYDFRETLLDGIGVKNCVNALVVGDTVSTDTANQLQLIRFHAVTGTRGVDASGTSTRVFVNAWGCEISDMSGAGVKGKFTGSWVGGQIRATDIAFDFDDVLGMTLDSVNMENQTTGDVLVTLGRGLVLVGCVGTTTVAGAGRDYGIALVDADHCAVIGGRTTVHANDSSAFIGMDLPSTSKGTVVLGWEPNGTYTSGTRQEMQVATLTDHFIWTDRYNWIGHRSALPSGAFPIQSFQTTGVPGDTGTLESLARYRVRTDGLTSWSDGSATADLQMERQAAGVMRINAGAGNNPTLLLNATKILPGTGTPEGAVTAPVGSLFLRTDGGAGTSLYIKETGAGNTGWRAV